MAHEPEYIPLDEIAKRLDKPLMTIRDWSRPGHKIPLVGKRLITRRLRLGKRGQLVLCGPAAIVDECREAKSRQDQLNETWATLDEFARNVGVTLSTVCGWIYKKRTRWLEQPFVAKPVLVGPRGREIASVPRAWIQEINDAKARVGNGTGRSSEDAVSVPDFAKIAGISEYLTRHWLTHPCKLLGRPIRKQAAPCVPGVHWRKHFLAKEDARTVERALRKESRPKWVLIGEAARDSKRAVVTVKAWTAKDAKVPALGNKPLDSQLFYAMTNHGRLWRQLYVSKSQLERIKSWQPPRPPEKIDVGGVMHYRREKSAEFCRATPAAFQRWYRRTCTFLDGEKLEPYTRPDLRWRGRQILYFPLPKLLAIRKAREEAQNAGWCGYGGLPVRIAADPAPTNGHARKISTRGRPAGVSSKTKRMWNAEDKLFRTLGKKPTTTQVANECNRGKADGRITDRHVSNARQTRKRLST